MRSSPPCRALTCFLALALLGLGCSGNSPLADRSSDNSVVNKVGMGSPEGPVQFVAQVQTISLNQRMLTFEGESDTVIALHNCQIVRFQNDNEPPVPFVDIGPGDSVYVNGTRMQDGYVYAHQLKVCAGGCDGLCYDVAFRDTIAGIDYGGGTFTVLSRTETITTDDSTQIMGVITRYCGGPAYMKQEGNSGNAAGEGPGYNHVMRRDTVLLFTDLQVGDIVEVRANVIDSSTLMAGKIILTGCDDFENVCIEFSDYLASVDTQSGLVTFENIAWVGTIYPTARLIGLDGAPIPLDEFNAGDYVDVKGFQLDGDSLQVNRMARVEP